MVRDGKRSVELGTKSAITQEGKQLLSRKVSCAERARVEVGPAGVDRRHDQAARRVEDSPRFLDEPGGVRQIVERLVEQHDPETTRTKGQGVRVQPYERNPAPGVPV